VEQFIGNITIIANGNLKPPYIFVDHIGPPLWSSQAVSPLSSQGRHNIPISFPLPKNVALMDKHGKAPQIFSLPPTFMERDARVTVTYRFLVTFRFGKFRADSQYAAFNFL